MLEWTQDANSVDQAYIDLNNRINLFAEQNNIRDSINEYLVMQIENNAFSHTPHLVHLGIDCLQLILNRDFAFLHDGLNYYNAYSDHKINAELQRKCKQVSYIVVNMLINLGEPQNYADALAFQRVFSKINLYFLDPEHYESYRLLVKRIDDKVAIFSQSVNLQQFQGINNKLDEYAETNKKLAKSNENILNNLSSVNRRCATTKFRAI